MCVSEYNKYSIFFWFPVLFDLLKFIHNLNSHVLSHFIAPFLLMSHFIVMFHILFNFIAPMSSSGSFYCCLVWYAVPYLALVSCYVSFYCATFHFIPHFIAPYFTICFFFIVPCLILCLLLLSPVLISVSFVLPPLSSFVSFYCPLFIPLLVTGYLLLPFNGVLRLKLFKTNQKIDLTPDGLNRTVTVMLSHLNKFFLVFRESFDVLWEYCKGTCRNCV